MPAGTIVETTGGLFNSESLAPALQPPKPHSAYDVSTVFPSALSVAAAEYFIDTVGADGSGQVMSAVDGAFDARSEAVTASVDVSALSAGQHQLFVHGQDSRGKWGPVQQTTLVVSGGASDSVWLEPQQSAASYCTTAEVEVWANASNFQGGQIMLQYDPSCAEVTEWSLNAAEFPLGGWESDTAGEEWITFSALEPLTGRYLIGTLTVHCNSQELCATALDFVEPSALFDDLGAELSVTWEDGSFGCTAGHCGDVAPYPDCNEIVDMGDVVLLLNYVGHPGEYELCCETCGNVAPYPDCNDIINMGDVVLLLNHVGHPGQYGLCCDPQAASAGAPQYRPTLQSNVHLVPPVSSAAYLHTTEVQLWVDEGEFQGGQAKLRYDANCAEVVNWERNATSFPLGVWDSEIPGEEWITFSGVSMVTGAHRIGTLTIRSVSDTECETPLRFVQEDGAQTSKLFDDWGSEVPAIWTDGSFRGGSMSYLPLLFR
jgi:hypothetical protein